MPKKTKTMPKHRLERIPIRWRIKHFIHHWPQNWADFKQDIKDIIEETE